MTLQTPQAAATPILTPPNAGQSAQRGHRHLAKAQQVVSVIKMVLGNRPGANPNAVVGAVLTDAPIGTLLFVILDPKQMTSVGPYFSEDTLKLVRASIGGGYLVIPTEAGQTMRYSILMGSRPVLPKLVQFPAWRKGIVQLGVRSGNRPADLPSWYELGNVVIAGMTQWGKSVGCRLVTAQAAWDGFQLYLGNFASNTFNPIVGISHPQIKRLETTPEGYLRIAEDLVAEITRRASLFAQCAGSPDTLAEYNARAAEPLPGVLCILDEYSQAVQATGGTGGQLSAAMLRILSTGLKYGVQTLLASQEFYVDEVGRIKGHCATRICLHVGSLELSRSIVRTGGAEKIKVRGRALTNNFGTIQMYLLEKEEFAAAFISPGTGMTKEEEHLAQALYSYAVKPGWMSISRIQAHAGLSQDKARGLRSDWVARGLARHLPLENNAIFLTNQFSPIGVFQDNSSSSDIDA